MCQGRASVVHIHKLFRYVIGQIDESVSNSAAMLHGYGCKQPAGIVFPQTERVSGQSAYRNSERVARLLCKPWFGHETNHREQRIVGRPDILDFCRIVSVPDSNHRFVGSLLYVQGELEFDGVTYPRVKRRGLNRRNIEPILGPLAEPVLGPLAG